MFTKVIVTKTNRIYKKKRIFYTFFINFVFNN